MPQSPRLGLPLLSAGQAQKEITHNEALVLMDALLHGCCSGAPSNNPPQSPEPGQSYICGSEPTGAWTGRSNGLACWTESGWRFVEPFDGICIVDRSSGREWSYLGGEWSTGIVKASEVRIDGLKVLGKQQPSIAGVSGGTTIDTEARNVLTQVLMTLRSHGLIAPAG